jgi:hypothetical protein
LRVAISDAQPLARASNLALCLDLAIVKVGISTGTSNDHVELAEVRVSSTSPESDSAASPRIRSIAAGASTSPGDSGTVADTHAFEAPPRLPGKLRRAFTQARRTWHGAAARVRVPEAVRRRCPAWVMRKVAPVVRSALLNAPTLTTFFSLFVVLAMPIRDLFFPEDEAETQSSRRWMLSRRR